MSADGAELARIYRCARDLIRKGFTRGALRDRFAGEDRYCIIGAVVKCSRGDEWLNDMVTDDAIGLPEVRRLAQLLPEVCAPEMISTMMTAPRKIDPWGLVKLNDFVGGWMDDIRVTSIGAAGLSREDVVAHALDLAAKRAEEEGFDMPVAGEERIGRKRSWTPSAE